jgi:hypothetical protein
LRGRVVSEGGGGGGGGGGRAVKGGIAGICSDGRGEEVVVCDTVRVPRCAPDRDR